VDKPGRVCVFVSGSAGIMAVAKSLLQADGIEFVTRNETTLGYEAGYIGSPEIWVRAADANESRIILKDLAESQ
jgi:Putative prokaryotic signal transducing protein